MRADVEMYRSVGRLISSGRSGKESFRDEIMSR